MIAARAGGSEASAVVQTGRKPVMSLRGVAKRFGSVSALRGVDLDLYGGECLGLIGDNAAGKSTLTKIIAGTYAPDRGSLELDGELVEFAVPADADRHRGDHPGGNLAQLGRFLWNGQSIPTHERRTLAAVMSQRF